MHLAESAAVELNRDAVILRVGSALQNEFECKRERRRCIGVDDIKLLAGRLGGDDGAEEIVFVFAVEKSGKVRRAVFAEHGEGKTCRRVTARGKSGTLADALGGTIFLDEPIDARAGEGRVETGAEKIGKADAIPAFLLD